MKKQHIYTRNNGERVYSAELVNRFAIQPCHTLLTKKYYIVDRKYECYRGMVHDIHEAAELIKQYVENIEEFDVEWGNVEP